MKRRGLLCALAIVMATALVSGGCDTKGPDQSGLAPEQTEDFAQFKEVLKEIETGEVTKVHVIYSTPSTPDGVTAEGEVTDEETIARWVKLMTRMKTSVYSDGQMLGPAVGLFFTIDGEERCLGGFVASNINIGTNTSLDIENYDAMEEDFENLWKDTAYNHSIIKK